MYFMPRLLLVEDDPDIAFIVEYIFNNRNYKVAIDKTGKCVHEQIKNFCPDIIILDIWLPGIDGLKLCKQIKELNNIPVVLFSAGTISKAEEKFSGADAFLEKPFDITELEIFITALLQQ